MRLFLVALFMAALSGCASLPSPIKRSPSTAFANTEDTHLGRAIAPYLSAHPGLSGVHALPWAYDAFAARVVIATAAQKSLDTQCFIWHDDQVGSLLFEALWNAAQRGVRVRRLLDDANTSGLDPTLAVLDAHPNIELRLYNPFALRGSRALGYLDDFQRLNRRMHNKSFTADNQISVVGGRNIANEYFGAGGGLVFADADVLLVGPAVAQVSTEFDLYSNSASAYPAAPFVGAPAPDGAARLQARFAQTRADPLAVDKLKAVGETALLSGLLRREFAFEWTNARVLYDDPAKTLDDQDRTKVLLFLKLLKAFGRAEKSFNIVSPYFVPGEQGTADLAELARRGVKVRVLTNSVSASDERVVHAGYMKRRVALLRAGVALWELKPSAHQQVSHVAGRFGAGKVAGLHAKTYAVDDARIFVGSFNFDLRSARLNTEMGVLIDSASFAQQLATLFDTQVPSLAYEVRLQPGSDSLVWIERGASGKEQRYDVDPETNWSLRFGVGLLSGLPIDWLL